MKHLILGALLLMTTQIAQARANANDTLEIIQTVDNIGTAADSKDWKKCRAQFAEKVWVDYSALSGQAAAELKAEDLVSAWAKVLGPVQMTQHTVTNHEIVISGNEALVRSYVSAMHHHPVKTGEDFWLLLGKYEHRLEKTEKGWRVTSIKLVPTYQSGNPNLLAQASQEGK